MIYECHTAGMLYFSMSWSEFYLAVFVLSSVNLLLVLQLDISSFVMDVRVQNNSPLHISVCIRHYTVHLEQRKCFIPGDNSGSLVVLWFESPLISNPEP